MIFDGQAVDVVTYVGHSISRCGKIFLYIRRAWEVIQKGYCGKEDTSHSFGLWAHSLRPSTYQKLIDRGWRRSGQYLYRPNLRRSCCKSYTIRLDAGHFKPDKKHRQALNKFNRFVLGEDHVATREPQKATFDLAGTLREAESAVSNVGRNFRSVYTKSNFTKEKFELYKKYQIAVHHDEPSSLKRSGFERFLCDSPIQKMPLPDSCIATGDYMLDTGGTLQYGSYHQLYRMNGKLMAMAVLDILPNCVSSVYFIYDPDYAHLSLGRVSACREAALAQTLKLSETTKAAIKTVKVLAAVDHVAASKQGRNSGSWYYMGFYIPTCPKMAYKGEYSPSWLLDPGASVDSPIWHPLSHFKGVWAQRENEKVPHGNKKTTAENSRVPEQCIDWLVSFSYPEMQSTQDELVFDANEMSDPATLWRSDMPGMTDPAGPLSSQLKVLDSGYVRHLDDDLLKENPVLSGQLKAIRAACGHEILSEAIVAI